MIEQLIPLKIPPGLVMNGSLMDKEGRWMNGNLVRFSDGVAKPIGGWVSQGYSGTIPTGGAPTGAFGFSNTVASQSFVVCGKRTKIFVVKMVNNAVSAFDITPAAFPGSSAAASLGFANLGDQLFITNVTFAGGLWTWDSTTSAIATAVSGMTADLSGVFVTPERFVVVIQKQKTLRWASQGGGTVWTPASTNSAGAIDVPCNGALLCGHQVQGQTVVWSASDLWQMNYVGAPLYYGVSRIGSQCGLLGAHCVSIEGGTARWMGNNAFFQYDGYARELDCPVRDYVFGDMNKNYADKFFAVSIPQHNEIQWYYVSASAAETPNRYVSYDYANQTWSVGQITRAAGANGWPNGDSGATGLSNNVPLLFDVDGTTIYKHEQPTTAAPGAYLESGPFQVDDGGNKIARIQKIVPDGALTGGEITLYGGGFPGAAETTQGPFAVTTGVPLDCRFSARYVRYKQTLTQAASRIGVPKLGAILEGSR